MDVLLLKDIANLGLAGQVIKVKEGYARNFLLPRKLAKAASSVDVTSFQDKLKREKIDASILGNRIAMLAHQLKSMHLTLKEKVNDQGKLYGAVGADEVAALLQDKGITVNKRQIEFSKAVRSVGDYTVLIKLSSQVKPSLHLKVVAK